MTGQKIDVKYFGKKAVDHQQDAMESSKLWYEGHDYGKVVELLFKINDNLELFGDDADKFTMHEIGQRIIPRNLKSAATQKYIDKDGEELQTKEDIIDLSRNY